MHFRSASVSYYRLIFLRILIMFSNFYFNLSIAKILLAQNAKGQFGLYGIGVALTFFLPVMDFGLGQTIYNYYSQNSFKNRSIDVFKNVFKKLIRIFIVWEVSLFIILIYCSPGLEDKFFGENRNLFLSFILALSVYFCSIPFSIGFRILSSIPKISQALIIQSLNSPIIFSLFYLLVKNEIGRAHV